MESQIKEEVAESSLCFETSGDDLASLTFVEKYDRFLQDDHSEVDSDGEFFPDDTMLREEYAQIRNGTTSYDRTTTNRLAKGLPGKYRSLDLSDTTDEESTMRNVDSEAIQDDRSGLTLYKELIERLEAVRKLGEDGNSIFCTSEELEAVQERYGEILDFIHERSSTFERVESPKDSYDDNQEQQEQQDTDQQVREKEQNRSRHKEDLRLLGEKMESVQKARDKFYEVEQQVRDQIEQLELVERYKMESVG